jgi:methyltransferase (TIGR00027 family)
VRTRLIDELIARSIAEGADRVINLAAGLDARPYRLELPSSLVWIEADLGPLLDEKERLLAGERPRCQLRRERVDLSDSAARAAFLDRATDGAKRALVLTEGLLYLERAQVEAIARDLAARPAIAWWMTDLASPKIVEILHRRIGKTLGDGAAMKFAPENGVAFFRAFGWHAHEIRSYLQEAARHKRIPLLMRLFARLPDANPERLGNRPWGAIIRLHRDRAPSSRRDDR